jgi:hypothetical protein
MNTGLGSLGRRIKGFNWCGALKKGPKRIYRYYSFGGKAVELMRIDI